MLVLKHVAELSTLACKAEDVERCEEARKGVWRIKGWKRRGRQSISATSTLTLEQKCILNFQTEPQSMGSLQNSAVPVCICFETYF